MNLFDRFEKKRASKQKLKFKENKNNLDSDVQLICNKYGVAYKDVDDLCQHQLSVIDLEHKGPSKAFQKLIKQKKKSLNQTSIRDNKKPNLIEAVLNDDLSVEIESAQNK